MHRIARTGLSVCLCDLGRTWLFSSFQVPTVPTTLRTLSKCEKRLVRDLSKKTSWLLRIARCSCLSVNKLGVVAGLLPIHSLIIIIDEELTHACVAPVY